MQLINYGLQIIKNNSEISYKHKYFIIFWCFEMKSYSILCSETYYVVQASHDLSLTLFQPPK